MFFFQSTTTKATTTKTSTTNTRCHRITPTTTTLITNKRIPIYLFLTILSSSLISSSSSSSSSDDFRYYANLPPNVFAPTGRLHGVDRIASESSNIFDRSASLWLALKYGGSSGSDGGDDDDDDNNNDDYEGIVVVGIRSQSPHISFDNDDNHNEKPKKDDTQQPQRRKPIPFLIESDNLGPMTILSPHLLAFSGGNAIDATILVKRTRRTFDDLLRSEGHYGSRAIDGGRVLARRLADVAQLATQSMSGNGSGKMLACAALLVEGGRTTKRRRSSSSSRRAGRFSIWRVDPTGQFWDCHAGAVGRGAGRTERLLMKRIARSLKNREDEKNKKRASIDDDDDDDMTDDVATLSNDNVVAFLKGLSKGEALILATRCVRDTVMTNEKISSSSDDDGGEWGRFRAFLWSDETGNEGRFDMLDGEELRNRFLQREERV